MTIDCTVLETLARQKSLVGDCDVVRSGALRVCTPFLYPNGSNVDIFVESSGVDLFDSVRLTDFGQTAMYLRESQVKVFSTERRKQLIQEICDELGVEYADGMLNARISIDELTTVPAVILRLAQACIRLADFASHHRLRSANPFRDDVEDFLDASEFEYNLDVMVPSLYRQERIDFEVFSSLKSSYVLVLSAVKEEAAHHAANEIFRKWYDLTDAKATHNFVTVYNSASRSLRDDDLRRLGKYSKTVSYPEQQPLLVSILRNDSHPPTGLSQPRLYSA